MLDPAQIIDLIGAGVSALCIIGCVTLSVMAAYHHESIRGFILYWAGYK